MGTLISTPESGHRAGYDGAKRRKGSKIHIAIDTLGHLLDLIVTPADEEQDQAQVARLCEAVQEATGSTVTLVRRLAKDYERLPEMVAGLHVLTFVCLLLPKAAAFIAASPYTL